MDASGLPPGSRDALARLESMIRSALERPSPHLAAVASGAIEKGGNAYGTFYGGTLTAFPNHEPPFEYDDSAMLALCREVIGEAPGLRRFVIRCARESTSAAWEIHHKLIPGPMVDAMTKARAGIDKKMKAELVSLQRADARAVVFGSTGRSGAPELVRFATSGQEHLEPAAGLLDLLAETERLYRGAGHELKTAVWQLHTKSLSFTDHFW